MTAPKHVPESVHRALVDAAKNDLAGKRWTLTTGDDMSFGEFAIVQPFDYPEDIEVMPVSEHEVLREAAQAADDLLRRLDEWDVMRSTADGPYWRGEIARARAALEIEPATVGPEETP